MLFSLTLILAAGILAVCTLVLLAPISLRINTIEQEYALILAGIFRINYDYLQTPKFLRFSLFGCSWTREIRWPVTWNRNRLKQLGVVLKQDREAYSGVLAGLKDSWHTLWRLSSWDMDINLCTPDYMANAVLSVIFLHTNFRGVRIRVNYLEENWLVGWFTIHLWAVIWVGLKFLLARPVSSRKGWRKNGRSGY